MSTFAEPGLEQTRRYFLKTSALSLAPAALALMNGADAAASETGLDSAGSSRLPHFTPRARRVIWLFMCGGPSQMDLYDHKPQTTEMFAENLPASVRGSQRLTTFTSTQPTLPIAPSPWRFRQHGQSGVWISELLPWTARMADDLCVVRSLNTEQINHDPAQTTIQTGNQLPGRPCLGSWLSWGLGSMNEDLPAFAVMTPSWTGNSNGQPIPSRLWGAGFLPGRHQGVALRPQRDAVLYLNNPPGVSREIRRTMLDGVAELNQQKHRRIGDSRIVARIAQYELAFRMQTSVPELTDISGETDSVLELYGPEVRTPGTFASSCLLARRLVERGVRMVQLFHRGWDHHFHVPKNLPNQCHDIDQACYGLVQDLKQRGLLDDTLVIWCGEFGRTVFSQGTLTRQQFGRDHHPRCFTGWMAGGGTRPATVYGKTDDFSYNIVEDPVHIRDLNATVLHLLGIDHQRFSVNFRGLDQRLTGVEPAQIVHGILA
ncbi:MAG: DUF1501 domain-containing protein [Planctomycetaceae bacterium]